MGFGDIMLIVLAVVVALGAGLYFLNRWASKKQVDQQNLIDKTKQQAQIYVIDKKHDKAANVTLPKAVTENMPRMSKVMKMYFAKCKVGPQIITMMCDKRVYDYLEPKKTYKAEVAGIYIVNVKGMKTAAEMKEQAKTRKIREKAEKRAAAK
ncbi:MAG: hypothetical protein LBS19_16595 [Clostridiales bacterium]|jgi:hypothetical protein|nr:hypothetical protein [Clostridiales bacterium]